MKGVKKGVGGKVVGGCSAGTGLLNWWAMGRPHGWSADGSGGARPQQLVMGPWNRYIRFGCIEHTYP